MSAAGGRRHMADLNEAMGNIRQVTFEEVTRIFYGYDGRGTWYPSPRWSCPLASWSRLIKSAPLKAGSSCVTLRRGISRLAKGHPNTVPFFAPLSSTPPGLHEQRVRVRQSLDASAYCSLQALCVRVFAAFRPPSAVIPSSAAAENSSSGLDAPRRNEKCVVTWSSA